MNDLSVRKPHCNQCGRDTNHRLLHKEVHDWIETFDDTGFEIIGHDVYFILRCLGCDYTSFLAEYRLSGGIGEHGRPDMKVRRFPPAVSRRHPDWFRRSYFLPKNVSEILQEIYVALQNGGFRLCALGIRALLEQIMIEKIGDKGRLGDNISEFFKAGYIAPLEQQRFRDKVIEMGNVAMHRGYAPSPKDIGTLLDITEGLIAALYVHPRQAAQIGREMPTRPSKSR